MKRDHEVRFPDRFWRRATDLSHDAKGLYATLVTFAEYRTGLTFVGNARLQLETGYGRDLVKKLLRELERAGFIRRSRQIKRNLLSKRWIHCLKYVVSDGLTFSPSARQTDTQAPENKPAIFTPVKSSVTPEEERSHLYPTQDHSVSETLGQKPERVM
ncbi:MAG TPA: helix-turn-helix domain-containing protein [Candidatus Acidoferrum sp.]|nr:helix-turn-helix domain-containing protein [Candidatus Acidoferrum sp.]